MKRVKVKLTNEVLSILLKVKDGIKIIDSMSNTFNNVTELLLESNDFDEVREGCEAPTVNFKDVSDVSDIPVRRYKQVIKTNLSYGQAMTALRNGDAVTRAIWLGYWRVEVIERLSNHIIVATCKDGSRVPSTPYQEDMSATDWMIVIPDESLVTTKVNEQPVVTDRDVSDLTYAARRFMLDRYDVTDQIDIIGFGYNEMMLITYLVARKIINIMPFSEAQVPIAELTEKGKSLLLKLREIEENR